MMKKGIWLVALVLVIVGCAQPTEQALPAAEKHSSSPPPLLEHPVKAPEPVDDRPRYTGFDAVLPDHAALVALAKGDTTVYEAPGVGSTTTTVPWTTILGTVSVFTVVNGPVDGWVEVMLPVRPNGTTGWVRIEEVSLYVVEGRIVVDLSDRELTYYAHGDEVLKAPVAVGTSRNPTPTGQFYVTDSVTMAREGGPWGPYALGLSARSDTITEFNGGDGIIGIHGTNRPSSIGEAASLGCVRLANDVITRLHEMVPIGTPVEIRA